MKVTLIKQSGRQYDITNAVTRVEWSGSASAAARQLSISYLNAPNDRFDLPAVATGDFVSLAADNGEELFFGQFFGAERSSLIGTLDYTACDMMKNLLESQGQYNFKNLTAEAVAAQVCDECGFPVRSLYPTGVNIASLLCDGMSLYDVIMAAYTKAHRITGDKYFLMIRGRGLCAYRSGQTVKGFVLSDASITEASIQETMENIVNRVKIYDEYGAQTGEVQDTKSMEKYGTFQKVYKQEADIDPHIAAQNMLVTTPAQTLSVSAIGCVDCLSCYYVMVSDAASGMTGRYWISSDRHCWENGMYTMELTLEFDAVMETRDASGEDEYNVG